MSHLLGWSEKFCSADLYLDFVFDLDMEGWRREAWVSRAKAIAQYAEKGAFTVWTIGVGGTLSARLHQKVNEAKKSGKQYLHDLWQLAGWDGVMPVWRMEFQFKREVLTQLRLDTLPSIMEHQDGLWSYATTDWLHLCIPNQIDKTRSRWPIHPLWMALSSVDWGVSGGPLSREYTASKAPSLRWLGSRGASVIASIGAVPNGKRVRQSAGTVIKEDAEAYLAKIKLVVRSIKKIHIKPPQGRTYSNETPLAMH